MIDTEKIEKETDDLCALIESDHRISNNGIHFTTVCGVDFEYYITYLVRHNAWRVCYPYPAHFEQQTKLTFTKEDLLKYLTDEGLI